MQLEILNTLVDKRLTVKELVDFLKANVGGEGDEDIHFDSFFYTIDDDNEIKIKFEKENITDEKIKILSVEIIKLD